MITTIVQFTLHTPISRQGLHQFFAEIAPAYRDVPGLIRKQFLLSDDGTVAGGAYLWQSREDALRFYSDSFKQQIYTHFGSEPTITHFESPVIVDNEAGRILQSV